MPVPAIVGHQIGDDDEVTEADRDLLLAAGQMYALRA